jgi:hypothetical protein
MSGVTLLVSYDGDPGCARHGDSQRLLQVFDGLVAEAIAGMRRGAVEASLRAVIEADSVRVTGAVRAPATPLGRPRSRRPGA